MTWRRALKVIRATSSKSKLVRRLQDQPVLRAPSARLKQLSATSCLNTMFPSIVCTAVALGNAAMPEATTEVASNNAPADQTAPKPAATKRERVPSTVHIKLMENSLAAQGSTSPHGMASSTGAEQQ